MSSSPGPPEGTLITCWPSRCCRVFSGEGTPRTCRTSRYWPSRVCCILRKVSTQKQAVIDVAAISIVKRALISSRAMLLVTEEGMGIVLRLYAPKHVFRSQGKQCPLGGHGQHRQQPCSSAVCAGADSCDGVYVPGSGPDCPTTLALSLERKSTSAPARRQARVTQTEKHKNKKTKIKRGSQWPPEKKKVGRRCIRWGRRNKTLLERTAVICVSSSAVTDSKRDACVP